MYDDKSLIEAGCRFIRCDVTQIRGIGYLLHKGACICRKYSRSDVPENGHTKSYTNIVKGRIIDVDSSRQEVLMKITTTMRWRAPGISAYFSHEDIQDGGIAVDAEELKTIWKPDLYI